MLVIAATLVAAVLGLCPASVNSQDIDDAIRSTASIPEGYRDALELRSEFLPPSGWMESTHYRHFHAIRSELLAAAGASRFEFLIEWPWNGYNAIWGIEVGSELQLVWTDVDQQVQSKVIPRSDWENLANWMATVPLTNMRTALESGFMSSHLAPGYVSILYDEECQRLVLFPIRSQVYRTFGRATPNSSHPASARFVAQVVLLLPNGSGW